MCLEDRFLLALYAQPGYTSLKELAGRFSLTETALLSIVHRIVVDHPEFLLQEGGEEALRLSPNKEGEGAVRAFVESGGYTAINEEEFRRYYQEELSLYNRLQRLKENVSHLAWVKWTGIVGLSLAAGFGLTSYLRSAKR